jgi:hypothetical protein
LTNYPGLLSFKRISERNIALEIATGPSAGSGTMNWSKTAVVGVLVAGITTLSDAQSEGKVAPPAQIIVIRHAEKPRDETNPHLSPAGQSRAQQLVPFITTDGSGSRFGTPAALFAPRPTRDGQGQRSLETLTPLATALKLDVQTPYRPAEYAVFARWILRNPAYSGKTVVIAWTHDEIPDLVAELGVKPKPQRWKSKVYDLVYVITYRDGNPELGETRYGPR